MEDKDILLTYSQLQAIKAILKAEKELGVPVLISISDLINKESFLENDIMVISFKGEEIGLLKEWS